MVAWLLYSIKALVGAAGRTSHVRADGSPPGSPLLCSSYRRRAEAEVGRVVGGYCWMALVISTLYQSTVADMPDSQGFRHARSSRCQQSRCQPPDSRSGLPCCSSQAKPPPGQTGSHKYYRCTCVVRSKPWVVIIAWQIR